MSVGGVDRLPRVAEARATDWSRLTGRSGKVELVFETLPGRWVSPGTGRIEMLGAAGAERLVLAAARRAGQPVLPGSGIKGAVRTIFELITSSCTPFDDGGTCCTCAACSLFGCIGRGGHRGRLGFDDAVAGEVRGTVELVPVPFQPHAERTPGDVRLYDLRPKESPERELAREAYRGAFAGRMSVDSAAEAELGRVGLALGLGPEEVAFPLRLGGVRYDGQGAVRVALGVGRFAEGAVARSDVPAEEMRRLMSGWAAEALQQLEAPQRDVLRQVAAILRREGQ